MPSRCIDAQIVLCNSFDTISQFISEKIKEGFTVHCVETEYGSKIATGNGINLIHHGNSSHNPVPCLFPNLEGFNTNKNIVCLSHIDLDAIGGTLAILGLKPEAVLKQFWKDAARADVFGPHRIDSRDNIAMFWAWSQNNRGPRASNEIQDVRKYFESAYDALEMIERILWDDEDDLTEEEIAMIEAGEKLLRDEEALNEASFVSYCAMPLKKHRLKFSYCVRSSDKFVNHLYETPQKNFADCVIAFNEKFGSITISFERNLSHILSVDCREIVQSYPNWGCDSQLAGGKDIIAGSPREMKYDRKFLHDFVGWFCSQLPAWYKSE